MPDELRKKAEELLNKNPVETPVLSTADVQKLLHELDVHQVELQMQNEELRTAQEELAHSRDSYVELFDFAPVGYLIVDYESRIMDANFAAAALLGLERGKLLVGRTFAGLVSPASLNAWELHQRHVQEHQKKCRTELVLQHPDGNTLHVHLECTPRPDSGRYLMALVDITKRVQAEEAQRISEQKLALLNLELEQRVERRTAALQKSEREFRSTINDLLVGVVVHDADTSILYSNQQASRILGLSQEQMNGKKALDSGWHFVGEDLAVVKDEDYPVRRVISTGERVFNQTFGICRPDVAEITWVTLSAVPVFSEENVLVRVVANFMDITELKRMQEALEKRVLALTRPLDQPEAIAFDDLFDRQQIQRIQDEFSAATGVASIITAPDGTPITEPSNFTDLCFGIIRKTEKGCANCYKSDAFIGRYHPDGPIVQPCLSGGLWDAGASIEVGGRHIANWLIGQVRDESQTDEDMLKYARKIGADEHEFMEAFHRVPVMNRKHFEGIAQALFTLAGQLSTSAYQNVQQARFIAAQKQAELALKESEDKYRKVFESESDAIMIFDGETRQFVDVNHAAVKLYGYSYDEFLQRTHGSITADPELADSTIPATLAGERLLTFTSKHRKRDGTVFPVEIAACTFSWKGRPVICGVIRDITQRRQQEEEIFHNQRELRKLASELSLAEQRERQRVASELHDGVSQLLSSSYLRLSVLKESTLPEPAVEALDTICGILQDTLQQIRSLTFELSCPMLNELGLAAALEELCASLTSEYSICFEFRGDMQLLSLPLDRKVVLFRCVRELLINVIKHSESEWACVKLDCLDGNARICVEDDGKGFDASMAGKGFSPSGGFGLFNLREYLLHAGGTLQIESFPDNGTEVVLTVPLEVDHG